MYYIVLLLLYGINGWILLKRAKGVVGLSSFLSLIV